jgi:hypothetical protein
MEYNARIYRVPVLARCLGDGANSAISHTLRGWIWIVFFPHGHRLLCEHIVAKKPPLHNEVQRRFSCNFHAIL